MAKLIVTDARGNSREIPLDKDRVSIGWYGDNDIRPNDKAVSGRHAHITTVAGESTLEDLGTSKGTLVNGAAVSRHLLSDGDLISIGRTTLHYQHEAMDQAGVAMAPKLEAGGTFGASVADSDIVVPATPTTDRLTAPAVGLLQVISGPHIGRQIELSKALTTIGRAGAQVAAITRRADGFYIAPAGALAGEANDQALLKVNDIRVDTLAHKLSSGDTIELIGTRMTFVAAD